MGQRGQRKPRRRCQFVDPRSGLRCRLQVKKAGNTYCSVAHAAASRPKAPREAVVPGAKATHQRARAAARVRLAARLPSDAQGRVDVGVAIQVALDARDESYRAGYHAALMRQRKHVHRLRLTQSRAALDEFLGSRFGKGFITGDLRPEDLANFSFGNSRSAAAQRRFRRRRSRKS